MALNKIQFRTSEAQGDTYTVIYNPSEWDNKDSVDYKLMPVLDGSPVRSVATFDDRVRTMKWPAHLHSNAAFTGMVSTLKAYKGLEKEVDFRDIDVTSMGWRRIKILDVRTSKLTAGGSLRYTLELDYVYLDPL